MISEIKSFYPVQSAPIRSSIEASRKVSLQAKTKAAEQIELAKIEAEKIKKAAYSEGFDTGVQHALKEVFKLEQVNQKFLEDNKQTIIDLALKISQEIINSEISHTPRKILHLLQACLERASSATQVKILASPIVASYLQNKIEHLGEKQNFLSIDADQNLNPGDFVIRTPNGEIISTIDSHLEALGTNLKANAGEIFGETNDK